MWESLIISVLAVLFCSKIVTLSRVDGSRFRRFEWFLYQRGKISFDLHQEKGREERFEEILRTIPKYGKNDKTLDRCLGYHEEIQGF